MHAEDFDNDLDMEIEDGADDEAFISYDIAVYPADYTLSVINEMWEACDIVVPEFQRKFVWTIKQSSLLIESFLMGLPVPQAFFYIDADSKSLVIDGLQRIMSVVYYMSGFFGEESYQGKKTVFRLAGLSSESPYYRKTFAELSESDQRKLKNRVLRVINVRQVGPKNDDTSAYHIFERLNTGGTPLRAQEIRHCVFHGGLVELLSELNKFPAWREILGKSVLDKHQKDIELLLRVFAFSVDADKYEKPMKEFLNKTMKKYRAGKGDVVAAFVERFKLVCNSVVEQLGEKPFNLKGKLNASALDSVLGALIGSDKLPPHDLNGRYQLLTSDDDFISTLSVSTSDAVIVKKRLEAVRKNLLV